MCIIIDANFAADLFKNPKIDDNAPVIRWLFNKGKDDESVKSQNLPKIAL